jgi:hypothetical protein
MRKFDVNIDTIQQRTGNVAMVPGYLRGRTRAGFGGVTGISAWARV